MADGVDRIVEEFEEYGWNRQRFIENAIAEMIMKIKSTEGLLLPNATLDIALRYYEEHQEELRKKHGTENIIDFINFCIRQCLNKKGSTREET